MFTLVILLSRGEPMYIKRKADEKVSQFIMKLSVIPIFLTLMSLHCESMYVLVPDFRIPEFKTRSLVSKC